MRFTWCHSSLDTTHLASTTFLASRTPLISCRLLIDILPLARHLVLDLPLELLDVVADLLELPRPVDDVQEGPQVMAVVIRVVRRQVRAGREDDRLVSVHGVEPEEAHDLVGNLPWVEARPLLPVYEQALIG